MVVWYGKNTPIVRKDENEMMCYVITAIHVMNLLTIFSGAVTESKHS